MANVSDPLLLRGGFFRGLLAWFGAILVAASIFFRMSELISFASIAVEISVSWRTLASLPWVWLFKLWQHQIEIERALSLTPVFGLLMMGISSIRFHKMIPEEEENLTLSLIFGIFIGLYFTFAVAQGISKYATIHSNAILYFVSWGIMGGFLFSFKDNHNLKRRDLFVWMIAGGIIGYVFLVLKRLFFSDDPFGDAAISSYVHLLLFVIIAF
ncbi:MAG: hypothetical protein HC850_16930 [Rhodomicrobium sp.]|nr:hypothetical protein [Rhodomicrobium sp.]